VWVGLGIVVGLRVGPLVDVEADVDRGSDVDTAVVVGQSVGAEVGSADAAPSWSRERITEFANAPRMTAVTNSTTMTTPHCLLDTDDSLAPHQHVPPARRL
jgi:hypothetical protein